MMIIIAPYIKKVVYKIISQQRKYSLPVNLGTKYKRTRCQRVRTRMCVPDKWSD